MSSTVVIHALPEFVSAEEHSNMLASTPASFADIRPVLRHRQDNVALKLDPPLDAFSLDDCAAGVLYVVESALVFMSSTGRGLQVNYPAITLHAISRGDPPSIYCQLDESTDDVPVDEDVADMRELTIVPQDPASLEPIFEAMSLCTSLHPDPDTSEDDELDGDFNFVSDGRFETLDGDEQQEMSEVGRAALAYLESIIDDPFHSDRDEDENKE